jgi:hypothetical protein
MVLHDRRVQMCSADDLFRLKHVCELLPQKTARLQYELGSADGCKTAIVKNQRTPNKGGSGFRVQKSELGIRFRTALISSSLGLFWKMTPKNVFENWYPSVFFGDPNT